MIKFSICTNCKHIEEKPRKGLCQACYCRLKRNGTLERKKAPKGSGYINANGYKTITVNGVRTTEHRHKTNAKPGQIVHHKDGNKLNNDLENLEVLNSIGEHMQRHRKEH